MQIVWQQVSGSASRRKGEKLWQTKHQNMREKHHLDPSLQWQSKLQSLTERERDVLSLCYQYERKRQPSASESALIQDLVADVSQNGDRACWSRGVRSLVQHSEIYLFEQDRVVTGAECFSLLGSPLREHRAGICKALSQKQLKGLAGEAFGAPCAALAAVALLISLQGEV